MTSESFPACSQRNTRRLVSLLTKLEPNFIHGFLKLKLLKLSQITDYYRGMLVLLQQILAARQYF